MPTTHHRIIHGLVSLAKISSLNGAEREAIIDLGNESQDPLDALSQLLEEICEGSRPIPRDPVTPEDRLVCALTGFIEKVISYQDPEWDVADLASSGQAGTPDPALDEELIVEGGGSETEAGHEATEAGEDTVGADGLSGDAGADTMAGAEGEDVLDPPAQTDPQSMSENADADVVVMNTGGVDGSPPGKPPKKVPKDA